MTKDQRKENQISGNFSTVNVRQTEPWGLSGRKIRIPGTSGCINSAKVCEQLGQGQWRKNLGIFGSSHL